MKTSGKYLLQIFILLAVFSPLLAQKEVSPRLNIYETWIILKHDQGIIRGVLYEVRDSSLLLAKSKNDLDSGLFDFKLTEVRFQDIDLVKIRRTGKIQRGIIAGSALGFGTTLGILINIGGNDLGLFFRLVTAIYIGIPAAATGGVAGILVGSIRDRFPVYSNMNNFNMYKGWFEDYSYIHEDGPPASYFQHRFYVSAQTGFSLLPGKLPVDSGGNLTGFHTRSGYSFGLDFGYRINDKLGIVITNLQSGFDVSTKSSDSNWSVGGILAGPVFSFPSGEKAVFELTPSIGWCSAYLITGGKEVLTGEGLGIAFNASLVYNYSKRSNFFARMCYYSSFQNFGYTGGTYFQTFNLGAGYSYRFGRKPL